MRLTRREFLEATTASAMGLTILNTAASPVRAKVSSTEPSVSMPAMWISHDKQTHLDTYGAFRGTFSLSNPQRITIRVLGSNWFNLLLDGEFLTQGPYRFPPSHPEYEVLDIDLSAGRHVLAATVRAEGVSTRLLQGNIIPPFLMCQVTVDNSEVAVDWKCLHLRGFVQSGQRINPQFAWIEWCDTRKNPTDWHLPDFDDTQWMRPVRMTAVESWQLRPTSVGYVLQTPISPKLIAQGVLTGPFNGAEKPPWKNEQDIAWNLRNLYPSTPPTGIWRRYDLGQVRLGRPEFTLDVPPGTVIEFGYSESLTNHNIISGYSHKTVVKLPQDFSTLQGRVIPYIPLSAGLSHNLVHYIARGGVQTFWPVIPQGGRYLEIHIQADESKVRFLAEKYQQRSYFGDLAGEFECADYRLNRIWRLGADTIRSCSEDAIIDNPTRERGQWIGDGHVSIFIAAASFHDLRLYRREIRQSAWCARNDGLVAGLCPGGTAYLSTYAAQWFSATMNYYRLTGDRAILQEMLPYARRNAMAFERAMTSRGIKPALAWPFIDWGFGGDLQMAVNLEVLAGFKNLCQWTTLLHENSTRYQQVVDQLKTIITRWLHPILVDENWNRIGYHNLVFALRNSFIPRRQYASAIRYIKSHILSCFPNNAAAPRLSNPGVRSHQIITPYFSYYVFPPLIENGEMDFVLNQYLVCWGWALDQGLTTQPEVFDLNWSHCHGWSGSPTAQLSQYVLGLQARYEYGHRHFDLRLIPGSLKWAAGKVPLPLEDGTVDVDWLRTSDGGFSYHIQTSGPIWLHTPRQVQPIKIEGHGKLILAADGALSSP